MPTNYWLARQDARNQILRLILIDDNPQYAFALAALFHLQHAAQHLADIRNEDGPVDD